MKNLYIIGNGFDMHHELKTHYQAFSYYLQDNYYHIHERFVESYGLPSLDPEDEDIDPKPADYYLWSEFEKRLADFDFQTIYDDNADLTANPASGEFRDGDWDTYECEMEGIVEELTTELLQAFKEFILKVDFPVNIDEEKLRINSDGFFVNFNYTDTLEFYYGISQDKILYIHNHAKSTNGELVLGHGIDPMTFKRVEPQPPTNSTEEELFEWREGMANSWELSSDRAMDRILTYFSKSHKQTAEVIQRNAAFFDNLGDTLTITVLGHSLGEVDHPYLRQILEKNDFKADWVVSYYNPSDAPELVASLVKLGLPQGKIRTFKMTDLLLN